jgi:hypothetical protein
LRFGSNSPCGRRASRGRGWTEMDRMFWVCLARLWASWRQSLQLVRPETVVGWHRQGFRRDWAWKSRRRSGRPIISSELRDLIRRMSYANPLWGAPRIHGDVESGQYRAQIRASRRTKFRGRATKFPRNRPQEFRGAPDPASKFPSVRPSVFPPVFPGRSERVTA